MKRLSSDQVGCRASSSSGVIRVAAPPRIGSTQIAPTRSIAIQRRSGDGAAAIDVPSVSGTSTCRVMKRVWACVATTNAAIAENDARQKVGTVYVAREVRLRVAAGAAVLAFFVPVGVVVA